MAGKSYTETAENWQMIRETGCCQLMYDTTRSRLKVRLIPDLGEYKLICSVSLGVSVKGKDEYFPWLVTPDVRKEKRKSLTLPLNILGIDGDVSIRRPEKTDNDPSAKYILRVEYEDQTLGKDVARNVIDMQLLRFRANINKARVTHLYEKLMEYFHDGNNKQEFGTSLYRNKDPEYFSDIAQNKEGIMLPYKKDKNGDQTNPLNDRVKGLFFCATLCDGELPRTSPFGPERFQANIQSLLENLGMWDMYFADFYCMEHTQGIHYVTLVLCKRGSESDQFCGTNLYRLPEQNPVFMISDTEDRFRICPRKYAWVEIFYTEAINIREMLANKAARMTHVKHGGNKRSKYGISKDVSCPQCNVEPRKWTPVEDET